MVSTGILNGDVNDPDEDDWIDRVLREFRITLPPVEDSIVMRDEVAIFDVDDAPDVPRRADDDAA